MSREIELRVANVDCENEAAAIRRGFAGVPGIDDVDVLAKSGKVRLRFDEGAIGVRAIEERLSGLGYPVVRGEPAKAPPPWRNPKVLASSASGVLLLAGWAAGLAGAPRGVSVAIYAVGILVGGYHFAREAVEELAHEREVGIELLMTVAALAAAALGEVGEAGTLVFLYSISEALEGYTEEKTRSAIRALMDLAPKVARVRRDGAEVEVPAEDLRVGEVFSVRPGEAVVTDGEIVSGRTDVDEAPVTGESVPVEKGTGDVVFAGSINGAGALEVRATRPYSENTISRIIAMVEEARERKGRSEQLIDRFGRRYSPAVLAAGVLVALLPPLLAGADWATWIERATVFIVAAAPCALVISVPIAAVATLGTAARGGVLVKGGAYLESLSRVRVVAMDKTGTLTRGEPSVTDVAPAEGHDARDVLGLAAAVERWSEHPLARAVSRHAREQGVAVPPSVDFRALTGAGAEAVVDGRRIRVGKPGIFDVGALAARLSALEAEGKTLIVVATDDTPVGVIALRDTLRPNARRAVDALRRGGVARIVMLTGDHAAAGRAIASEVGIDEVHAGLRPEDKVARVRDLASHGHVAMVGDGVNDAPALAEATVGVAMGAAGTDVALETADVALMGDDLERLGWGLALARRHRAVVRQNLVLSAIVIGGLVAGTLLGAFTLPVAVVAHEVSEILVIANGLRMLRAGA
ncbi:MAG: heavy metal translocating P-type ATPase [Myxococcota bacterium]